ncbi:MAG TPA: Mor transcription activator family protein [Steroidobacteraceae bacterium]|nr:Mor transcription activator family protein [Steroidobacteraceae bacterium]
MSHTEDHLAALRTRIVKLMREETGGDEQEALRMASRVMRAMMQELGGQEVYFRRPESYREADVIADINRGIKREEICQRYSISKTTYYRMIHRLRTAAQSR